MSLSRDEGPVAATSQYYNANVFIVFRHFKCGLKFPYRLGIERIPNCRSIDGHVSDSVLFLVEQIFKHGYRPLEQRFGVGRIGMIVKTATRLLTVMPGKHQALQ